MLLMNKMSPVWIPSAQDQAPNGSDYIAPDASGQNFFDIDPALHHLLDL